MSKPPERPTDRSSRKASADRGTGKQRTRDRKAYVVPAARRSILRVLGSWAVVGAIWAAVAGASVVAYFAYDLPDVSQVAQAERRPAVTVLAADGSTIERYGDIHGTTINAADLPPHLIHAVLATEDRRFFSHFGIDPIGLARAAFVNFQAGRVVQGGSTITQQLAKNLFLTPDRTMGRKIQEAILAIWLERTYSKNQILTAYLNRVYLGAGTYGVDAAAQTYFNKPATGINLREAAILAGLLKAPSRYSPAANPDRAAERAEVVIAAMLDAGYITQADIQAMRAAPPMPRRKPEGDGDRYFADWVADQIVGFIGKEHDDITVHTTMDRRLQRAAERRLEASLSGAGLAARAEQGALVALSPDGAVRALIGGSSYGESQFNRATQALRQPGSAFKPLVFLAALENGMTADSLVDDAPIRIDGWQPANFEKGFHGPMPLRDALAHSVNTAAIRVLDRTGVEPVGTLARRLGITSPMGKDLSLALGTSEVTLLELAGAYTAFANGGRAVWPYAVTRIEDRAGRLLYQRRGSAGATPVIDPADLAELNRMLMAVIEYGTGKSAKLGRMAAGKTGTSQEYRDAWFVGFTADYVAGVWLGNDDNEPMKRVTGGGLPARIWRDFMVDAHQGLPPREIPGLDYAPPQASAPMLVADDRDPGSAGDPSDPFSGPLSDVPLLGQFQRLIRNLTGGGD
ncbi:transglycosylase domain-containing protein [Skermanella pratensis]|uniref:transglycosylase domain-containing protein n=1 Tax=Skermanella pratensis TaxID=2233999 RepID=UPI001FE64EBD|nr:penicillin-binding protein 1A [Skermanella pratensis]